MRWLPWVLLCVACLVAFGAELREGQSTSYWKARAAENAAETRRFQAKYASAASHVVRITDTVRLIATRYKQVRDSVLITDTLRVVEFIRVADSALAACLDLVNACQQFRLSADSLVTQQQSQIDWLGRELSKRAKRKALAERLLVPALIGGIVIGAVVRGQP